MPRQEGRPRRGVPRRGQDCVEEEDEKDRNEEDGGDEEYIGEDGHDKAEERTDAARWRTTTANYWAGPTSAVDVVTVTVKQGWSWR